MPIPAKPVHRLLLDAAERYADRPCLEFRGRRWTYRETATLAAKAAAGFQKLGVTKGTRVGLLLPNTPYYPIAYRSEEHTSELQSH